MQFNRTLLNRLVAYLSRETHHRFRCFGCKRDVLENQEIAYTRP